MKINFKIKVVSILTSLISFISAISAQAALNYDQYIENQSYVEISGGITSPGIPNFQSVTDQIVRGGRPGNGDLANLQNRIGVRTVINLENKQPIIDQERQTATQLGINFYSSPMSAAARPTDRQVDEILSVLKDQKNFPIFIHCHHGQDRTGLIVGIYRVEVQGWTPAKAYQEMLGLGFHPDITTLDQYFRDRTGYQGQ